MTFRFGATEIRPASREVFIDGQPGLRARAFDLLLALIERRERMVAKHELASQRRDRAFAAVEIVLVARTSATRRRHGNLHGA